MDPMLVVGPVLAVVALLLLGIHARRSRSGRDGGGWTSGNHDGADCDGGNSGDGGGCDGGGGGD
jgi:hypothetical protein